MIAQREILADKINDKYKFYISINGIPEIASRGRFSGCHDQLRLYRNHRQMIHAVFDNAAQMAELSLLAQTAGGMDAAAADSFLIALASSNTNASGTEIGQARPFIASASSAKS